MEVKDIIQLKPKFKDKLRLAFRYTSYVILLIGALTFLAIIFEPFQSIIANIANSLGVIIVIIPFLLIFIGFIAAFSNSKSFSLKDSILSVKNSKDSSSYDLNNYNLEYELESFHGGAHTLFIPDKKRLYLISKDNNDRIKLDLNPFDMRDITGFLKDISQNLNIEIKER